MFALPASSIPNPLSAYLHAQEVIFAAACNLSAYRFLLDVSARPTAIQEPARLARAAPNAWALPRP
jgi:hypothetical protein